MKISLAFHIIGIVMWMGGLLILTRLMKAFRSGDSCSDQFRASLERRVFLGWVLPGLGLVSISGLYQIFTRGFDFYLKQGWFHAKLTLILVLLAVTYFTWREIAKPSGKTAKVMAFHGIVGLVLIAITFITMLGRM